MRFGALGMRVDTSGPTDGFGFVPGEPLPDALIVAGATDALGDAPARFTDRAEVLGLFGDLAGIAGDAVDAILAASFDQRALVISKATLGKYFKARDTRKGVSASPWNHRRIFAGMFTKGGRFPKRMGLRLGGPGS